MKNLNPKVTSKKHNLTMPFPQNLTLKDVIRLIPTNGDCGVLDSPGSVTGNPKIRLKNAAVLMPIIEKEDGLHILYTRRTETLSEHKGQVSFPGGAWEPGDMDLIATALRETWEEIGVPPERIAVLGCLPSRLLVTGYMVTPIIANIKSPYSFRLMKEEVASIFSIPILWLADVANHTLRDFEYNNAIHKVIYFERFSDEVLWGATARMTIELLELLGLK